MLHSEFLTLKIEEQTLVYVQSNDIITGKEVKVALFQYTV